jgi:DNA-binding beta-propeller fold protein YncE
MTIWYEADANWPQRPAGVAWGAMPGVAVDALDQVWLFTRAEPPVQVYTAAGKFVRSWGQGQIGISHLLRFDARGNVWLTDVKFHVVRQFTPTGTLLRTLGTAGVSGEDATHFYKPTDVAITPAGDTYVSDGYGNNRVVQFDAEGKFVRTWGKLGTGPGEFSTPHSIVVDSHGRLYVADRNNARIQVFDRQGQFLAQWRNLIVPWTLTITKDDQIWVAGSSPMPWRDSDVYLSCPPKDPIIMRFDTSGKVQQLWTLPPVRNAKASAGEVDWLHGLGVDSQGNLYVGDIIGKRAQKLVRHQQSGSTD